MGFCSASPVSLTVQMRISAVIFACLNELEKFIFLLFLIGNIGYYIDFAPFCQILNKNRKNIFPKEKMKKDEFWPFVVKNIQKIKSDFVLYIQRAKNGTFSKKCVFCALCIIKKPPNSRLLENSETKLMFFCFFRLIRFTPVN